MSYDIKMSSKQTASDFQSFRKTGDANLLPGFRSVKNPVEDDKTVEIGCDTQRDYPVGEQYFHCAVILNAAQRSEESVCDNNYRYVTPRERSAERDVEVSVIACHSERSEESGWGRQTAKQLHLSPTEILTSAYGLLGMTKYNNAPCHSEERSAERDVGVSTRDMTEEIVVPNQILHFSTFRSE